MSVALITGSGGLIGSAAAERFAALGLDIVGIDNDMRRVFFGEEASTAWNIARLRSKLERRYVHHDVDVRDRERIEAIFSKLGEQTKLVIHAAAQPSHDWAAREPFVDFDINATGTLNLLESTRRHCAEAPFIFTSTNKVYGDTPNELPLVELDLRYEIAKDHTYSNGVREDMRIDRSLHSIFGASKLAADLMVQEYGRYFGLKTVCFRGGTLTGPHHSATELHGFLAYVMRCGMSGKRYSIFGYRGKQVRDAIHGSDLINAFVHFFNAPRSAEVYNIGGGRTSNCSVLEAIEICERISGKKIDTEYIDRARVGDHIWWIGDNSRFQSHYPSWRVTYDPESILNEIHDSNRDRWIQPL